VTCFGGLALVPIRGRAASLPIEAKFVLEDRRLWVSASVNGSDPLLFVVDTGASSNFLRPELAKKYKMQVVAAGAVGDVGGKTSNTSIAEAREVAIGGAMRQSRVLFNTYDFERGLPDDAAGLFAAGLFTSLDTDLDFAAGSWRVWPKGRDGAPRGIKLDDSAITLLGGRRGSQRMYVTAQIDGKPYRLLLDTGAPGSLMLFPRASARSGLFETRAYAPLETRGFGGAASRLSRLVRADRLQLGPLALKRPFVKLMDPAQTTPFDIDGIIGLPLISLFDIATEAQAGKLWLARNTLKPGADSYSRSGLWLDRKGTDTIVAAVGKGSPAEAVGILSGDALVAPSGFAEAIRLINGDAGREIMISLRRDGIVSERRLTLTDYL
jgi:predicted aspartyl protease